jgi:hypothetical protein
MPSCLEDIALETESVLGPLFRADVHPFSPMLAIDSYLQSLDVRPPGKIAKVRMRLVLERDVDGHIDDDFEGVLAVSKFFDVEAYEELDGAGKWRAFIDLVHAAMITAARSQGWNEEPLERARKLAKSQGPCLTGELGPAHPSPNRRLRAQLRYEYVHAISVAIHVSGAQSNEGMVIAIATLPAIFEVIELTIGELKWISNDEIGVGHANEKDRWRISVGPPSSVEFFTARAERDDPHGLYDLGMMYLNGRTVLKDLDKARYWLERARERGYSKAESALLRLPGTK